MRMTIKTLLQDIESKVTEKVPDAEHYRGRLEEGFSRPAFLYLPIYQGEKKANCVTSEKNIEVQVIYYGKTDRFGRESFKDRLQVQEDLDEFLSQFYLEAGDRKLHFTYEWKDADGQMAFYLTFRFLDEAFDLRMLEGEGEKAAESVQVRMDIEGK
ncbi:MAG: hypothetical protein IJY52_00415 [Anaerotignum sp.]|nr:hypothetical protein [Anaerotignum sp.]